MNPKYDTTKISALTDIEKLRLATAYLNHLEPKNIRHPLQHTILLVLTLTLPG